ncbi:unnamed protein product, partial [Prorocentrum cordatum]
EGFDTRGFRARRGSVAGLLRRRGPRAPCEMRGRAAFARSARTVQRRRPSRGAGRQEARAGLLRECRGALRDAHAELRARSPGGYGCGHLWPASAEIADCESAAACLGSASGQWHDPEADLSDLSTYDGDAQPPPFPESGALSTCEAEACALRAADLSDLSTTCDGDAPPPSESNAASTAWCRTLQHPPADRAAEVVEAPVSFEQVREKFLRDHGKAIRRSLEQCLEGQLSLRPAPVSAKVQEQFMGAYRDCGLDGPRPTASLAPTFHGTHAGNHDSIFAHGLLIPGQAGVKVHNGSSHGRGVYTSSVESAWLSGQFCSAPRMLVCGVLDDAVTLTAAYRLGNFMVTAESTSVRHVGDAVVVFDARRVAPLFEASAERLAARGARAPAPPPPAPRQAA